MYLFPTGETVCRFHLRGKPCSAWAGPGRECHSNGTFLSARYPVAYSKNLHYLGAPLRNRTVDLLLTMDRYSILDWLVERLIRQNTSADQHPQALDRPSRARFATQSATQFVLLQGLMGGQCAWPVIERPKPSNCQDL
jgi:hypothetical protein